MGKLRSDIESEDDDDENMPEGKSDWSLLPKFEPPLLANELKRTGMIFSPE